MNDTKYELEVKNKVIILGVLLTKKNEDENAFLDDMLELKRLCESCEMEVVDQIRQNLAEINAKTYIGSGKIEEIRMAKDSYDADTLVCNDELSPAQIENLEDALDMKVIDRTYVILEIFKRRAKTKEAILQVEIASLKYYLPRLKGLREGLSRQGGSGKNKGKGETQLELDRRKIESRLKLLSDELKDLSINRKSMRSLRQKNNMKIVAFVGYTNSGKSTTINSILKNYSSNYSEDKTLFQQDMLFATLETSTRRVNFKNNIDFLITDTVGFINKLPHSLIEAFKSTLEEVSEADLIVHVIDSSNPLYQSQIEVTNKVLEELNVKNLKVLYAFNKQDKLDSYFYIPSIYENAVRYSAKSTKGLDELMEKIIELLFENYHTSTFVIPYSDSKIASIIEETSKVLHKDYLDNIIIEARVSDHIYNLYNKYIVK